MRRLLFTLALIGCDAYSRDLGPTPFLCGPDEPRCPMGYTCMMDGISGDEVCVGNGGSVTENPDCNDDSSYEPNNALVEAQSTTIDAMKTFAVNGLAICPANDRDVWSIMIGATTQSVELVVTYDESKVALQAAFLNEGGVPISNASPVAGMAGTIRATQQNLPVGKYYVLVNGPNTGAPAVNNYELTITASP